MFSRPGMKWPISALPGAAASSEIARTAAIRLMSAPMWRKRHRANSCTKTRLSTTLSDSGTRSELERDSHGQLEVVALRSVSIGIGGRRLDAIPDEAEVEIERSPDLEREHRREVMTGLVPVRDHRDQRIGGIPVHVGDRIELEAGPEQQRGVFGGLILVRLDRCELGPLVARPAEHVPFHPRTIDDVVADAGGHRRSQVDVAHAVAVELDDRSGERGAGRDEVGEVAREALIVRDLLALDLAERALVGSEGPGQRGLALQ